MAVPLLLAKLWSVIPRLFAGRRSRSPAQAIERLAIALLVASAIFQFATGDRERRSTGTRSTSTSSSRTTTARSCSWPRSSLHVVVKLPVIAARLPRARLAAAAARRPRAHAAGAATATSWRRPGGADDHPPRPARVRRRRVAALLRRQRRRVDRRAAARARVPRAAARGASRSTRPPRAPGSRRRWSARRYRLALSAARREIVADPRRAARDAAAHRAAADRLRRGLDDDADVDRRAAARPRAAGRRAGRARARSCARCSRRACCRKASLSGDAVADPDALLALQVNGADLSLDHGYPARIIVPALPGVHNTKWVALDRVRGMSAVRRSPPAPARAPGAAAAGRWSQVLQRVEREARRRSRSWLIARGDPARPRAAAAVLGRRPGRAARAPRRDVNYVRVPAASVAAAARRVLGHDRRHGRAALPRASAAARRRLRDALAARHRRAVRRLGARLSASRRRSGARRPPAR